MEILFIRAVYLFIDIHLFKNNRNIKRLLFDILSLFLILLPVKSLRSLYMYIPFFENNFI